MNSHKVISKFILKRYSHGEKKRELVYCVPLKHLEYKLGDETLKYEPYNLYEIYISLLGTEKDYFDKNTDKRLGDTRESKMGNFLTDLDKKVKERSTITKNNMNFFIKNKDIMLKFFAQYWVRRQLVSDPKRNDAVNAILDVEDNVKLFNFNNKQMSTYEFMASLDFLTDEQIQFFADKSDTTKEKLVECINRAKEMVKTNSSDMKNFTNKFQVGLFMNKTNKGFFVSDNLLYTVFLPNYNLCSAKRGELLEMKREHFVMPLTPNIALLFRQKINEEENGVFTCGVDKESQVNILNEACCHFAKKNGAEFVVGYKEGLEEFIKNQKSALN
ncbi:MAG: DUF4238 domain-containing protein [Christensenellaceae bacterium]|jgi:hypothetical protein|nr:DUF4238 domain-containing protein [Christensenellaceae bacterium]